MGEFLYNLSFGECKQCQATIVKSALPADDTLFEFSVENVFDFSLSDPSDTEEVVLFDPGDTITVTETLPPGWQLSNVSCDITAGIIEPAPIDGGVSLECVSEGAATCTFFNNPAPRPIPTLSEWGLIAMAGVIWIIGLLALRRRRVTA